MPLISSASHAVCAADYADIIISWRHFEPPCWLVFIDCIDCMPLLICHCAITLYCVYWHFLLIYYAYYHYLYYADISIFSLPRLSDIFSLMPLRCHYELLHYAALYLLPLLLRHFLFTPANILISRVSEPGISAHFIIIIDDYIAIPLPIRLAAAIPRFHDVSTTHCVDFITASRHYDADINLIAAYRALHAHFESAMRYADDMMLMIRWYWCAAWDMLGDAHYAAIAIINDDPYYATDAATPTASPERRPPQLIGRFDAAAWRHKIDIDGFIYAIDWLLLALLSFIYITTAPLITPMLLLPCYYIMMPRLRLITFHWLPPPLPCWLTPSLFSLILIFHIITLIDWDITIAAARAATLLSFIWLRHWFRQIIFDYAFDIIAAAFATPWYAIIYCMTLIAAAYIYFQRCWCRRWWRWCAIAAFAAFIFCHFRHWERRARHLRRQHYAIITRCRMLTLDSRLMPLRRFSAKPIDAFAPPITDDYAADDTPFTMPAYCRRHTPRAALRLIFSASAVFSKPPLIELTLTLSLMPDMRCWCRCHDAPPLDAASERCHADIDAIIA